MTVRYSGGVVMKPYSLSSERPYRLTNDEVAAEGRGGSNGVAEAGGTEADGTWDAEEGEVRELRDGGGTAEDAETLLNWSSWCFNLHRLPSLAESVMAAQCNGQQRFKQSFGAFLVQPSSMHLSDEMESEFLEIRKLGTEARPLRR